VEEMQQTLQQLVFILILMSCSSLQIKISVSRKCRRERFQCMGLHVAHAISG
jgi:hypothetical protein